MKETGGAFILAYCGGVILFKWSSQRSWINTFKQTWFITLTCFVCFFILIYFYLRLDTYYGGGTYNLSISNVFSGVVRLAKHTINTASYVIPAFLIFILGIIYYFTKLPIRSFKRKNFAKRLALFLYFIFYSSVMMAPLIPWPGLKLYFYLPGIFGAIIFSILAISMTIDISKNTKGIWKLIAGLLGWSVAILLLMHASFALMVGHLSEGRVRVNVDVAYDDVFHYVSKVTPTKGTVYFMIGDDQQEAKDNTIISLKIFYNRPDIKCVFPKEISDLNEPGLVCVTDIKRPSCFNYMRVVANESGCWTFLNIIQPKLHLQEVWQSMYSTPILYVTNHWAVPQYKSKFGIPAFWDLKKGVYEFGWKVYKYIPKAKSKPKQDIKYKTADKIDFNNFVVKINPEINPTLYCKLNFSEQFDKNIFFQPCSKVDQTKIIPLFDLSEKNSLRIVLYGDSIIRALGNGEHSWFKRLERKLNKFFPNKKIEVIMKAVGGDCTFQQSARLYSDVIAHKPDVVILHTAKTEGWNYHTYHKRLLWMTEAINALSESKVVLWTPTPFMPSQTNKYYDPPYFNSVINIGKTSECGIVDMRYAFLNNEKILKKLLWTDEKHPNVKGQELIADTMFDYFKKCFPLKNPNKKHSFDIFSIVNSYASTPQPNTNNLYNGMHPWNNKIELCRPVRVLSGTNAIAEDWIIKFISPNSFSVSGSITGFDGILTKKTNSKDLLFSHSRKIAFMSSDVWWSGNTQLYFSNDVFSFSVINSTNRSVVNIKNIIKEKHIPFSKKDNNLIENSTFDNKLKNWSYWQTASKHTNFIEKIHKGIKILNPNAQLIGLKQQVTVTSNVVYRLSGRVRSTVTNNPKILFGGRIGLYIPGQKEKQIVWMSEYNNWWNKELIFTNRVTGVATVYIHMGYGNVASTGEFTDIKLELIEK